MQFGFKFNFERLLRFCTLAPEVLAVNGDGPVQDGMSEASDVYHEQMRLHYVISSGRGGDWPEHSSRTIRRRGKDAPILIENGYLLESMSREGANHILEFTENSVREGTDEYKAHLHQHGDPSTNLPVREILVVPDANTIQMMQIPIVSGITLAFQEIE